MTCTCNENVVVREEKSRITLDGQGTATINGPIATDHTITVRGSGITIKGFTITGGRNGVQVVRGGEALIDGNTIQNTGNNGVIVSQHSSARIINNTIQNNPGNGINVGENSSARIGILTTQDTVASPNTIQNNTDRGIIVNRSSSARIVGNIISNNTDDGIAVGRASHADISSNTINSNGGDGIFLNINSGVNLGSDTGDGIFDVPNSTTENNTGFGIRCVTGGAADGRQGTLNGTSGAASFAGNCINSLIP